MGEMADDAADRGLEAWDFFCRDFIRERIPVGHWRTRQGDDLLISEMSKPHLENTIKYIEKCPYEPSDDVMEACELMKKELEKRINRKAKALYWRSR